jgi:polyisoprenoid-binding protein YceI
MATYNFEAAHTSAQFTVRHMMLTNVRGEFRNVTGTLTYDPANPNASTVEAQIEVKSMGTTGVEQRDAHLLSADFLDAEKFPYITFKSTKVEVNGESGKVYGDLTIKDVTRPVVLEVEKLGEVKSPWGQTVLGFSGSTKINREEFGLTWNVALETGGWLVGKDIKIDLDVEAIQVVETEGANA